MERDPFLVRLTEIDRACADLRAELDTLHGAVRQIRAMRAGGQPVSEIVARGPGIAARRAVRASWSTLDHALRNYRVQVVKSLVDDEQLSIADAARATGNARQVVSRLYHSPEPG